MLLKIRNTPNEPQNYLKHLTSQVSRIHWILIPEAHISLRFTLRPAIFKIQDCRKSEMHPMTPECPKNLSVKSTLYTLNTHLRGPNVTLFRSVASRFRDTGFSKIGNAPNDPTMTLITVVSKIPCVHWILTPGPNFNPFRSTTSNFRDTGLSKIRMHRMTPEWP